MEVRTDNKAKVYCSLECRNKAYVKEMAGLRFGRLIVLEEIGKHISKGGAEIRNFRCKCDCGKEIERCLKSLHGKSNKSCGCYMSDFASKRLKHGMSKTSEFYIWAGMKPRCYNPTNKKYHLYGGKGVIVCERWFNSFQNFYDDMGPKPSSKHSLDRINGDGNYDPSNCRWATPIEQGRNTKSNIVIDILGRKIVLSNLCEILKLHKKNIYIRLRSGQSHEEAIFGKDENYNEGIKQKLINYFENEALK